MPQYLGLGLDLRYLYEGNYSDRPPSYPIGIDDSDSLGELLLMREVVMMIVMDRLTDEPEWHRKIFDPDFVAKWALETLGLNDGPLYEQIAASENLLWIYTGRRSKNLLDNGCHLYVSDYLHVFFLVFHGVLV